MSQELTRRWVIVAAAVTPVLVAGRSAQAGASTPKSDVKYQFTPRGAERCGECISFLQGETTGAPGTCKIVQGAIPQNGWCVLFTRRKP